MPAPPLIVLRSPHLCLLRLFAAIPISVFALCLCLLAPPRACGTEEFAGPFPSWRNVKTDYGAVGDGVADDTAAMQRALDALTTHQDFCVLYLPAGNYRLTRTVKTVRHQHTECQGIAIVGESPQTTVLRWDGPAGGTVFQYDAWYSKISRLTIDGAGRAGTDLAYGPAFSTYNETSDLILRDAAFGLLFGGDQAKGQAENEVLRCRFLHCTDAGIKTGGFNCMDIWAWYSQFEDCGHALFNGAGNFHAWQNVFLRSKVADIGIANLMVFSFVNNTSIGSKRFLDFTSSHSWGSPMTISGNRILNPTDDFPVWLSNGGPYLVLDNVFALPPGSKFQAAKLTWGDQTFVGNTYSVSNAVLEAGRFRRAAEKVVAPGQLDATPPILPSTPVAQARKIIEVRPGADARAIQRALDAADQWRGLRPIIHLPVGNYNIAKTLIVAAGSDVQLVGDSAGETGSRLNWMGAEGGCLLDLKGPCRATLRDLFLNGARSRALLVENADQSGGKILADQLNVNGANADRAKLAEQRAEKRMSALWVNGLAHTDVLLRCLQGSGNVGAWVEVAGGQQGDTVTSPSSVITSPPPQRANQISIFNGASSSAVGQYDVHDGAQLVVRGVYHEKNADTLRGIYLTGANTLALDACRFSYKTSPEAPLVALTNFTGSFTMATSMLMPVDSTNTCRFEMTGASNGGGALALNDLFWVYETGLTPAKVWLNRARPAPESGLIGCNMNTSRQGLFQRGFGFLGNLWTAGGARLPGAEVGATNDTIPDAALLRHLAPLREAHVWLPGNVPAAATDLEIYRVMAIGGGRAVVEFRAGN